MRVKNCQIKRKKEKKKSVKKTLLARYNFLTQACVGGFTFIELGFQFITFIELGPIYSIQ